ncbi:putative trans-sialidase [Trypanosoma cruzi]|nr:putative trans-sialidase [Trypanosoma cruzi]
MEDGMLVFSFAASNDKREFFSITIYLTDNGNNWVHLEGISFAECLDSHATEWEGSPFMFALFESGRKLYELHEMGNAWTEAVRILPGVWVNSQSGVSWDMSLRVEALIAANIEGGDLMLYTQRG